MIDFLLRNAPARLRGLARWIMFFSILAAVMALISSIVFAVFKGDASRFFEFAGYALAIFSGGWVTALILTCISDAAVYSTGMGWRCSCGRVNEAKRVSCPRCGSLRRQ